MDEKRTEEIHLNSLYIKLLTFCAHCDDREYGREEGSGLYKLYSLKSETGICLYQSLTDEQLLDILKKTAGRLGHSPAQKEIFWVLREYIKKRFGKWPYALQAAGLKKSAGRGGTAIGRMKEEEKNYQNLLKEVQRKAGELCRIPHPKDVPELCVTLKKYANSWNEVIRDAGLNQNFFEKKAVYLIEDLEPEYRQYLQEIKEQADKLGRAPLKGEISPEKRKLLIQRCKSFRNALYQIGLEPVIRMNPFSATTLGLGERTEERLHKETLHDCYYRVLNMDEQTLKDLLELKTISDTLPGFPDKKQVPAELRKRLQNKCGSWANALYQIGLKKEQKK